MRFFFISTRLLKYILLSSKSLAHTHFSYFLFFFSIILIKYLKIKIFSFGFFLYTYIQKHFFFLEYYLIINGTKALRFTAEQNKNYRKLEKKKNILCYYLLTTIKSAKDERIFFNSGNTKETQK